MKKSIFSITFLILLLFGINIVYAELGDGTTDKLGVVTQENNTIATQFDGAFNTIFGTILTILKVLAVAGVVITGVRYMYAGPADKGQIKQSLIYIILGALLVFGTDIVVNLITGAWGDIS